MSNKLTLEDQLERVRQAKNKLLAKERKTLEAIRKKEAQEKIRLGGLVIKSGLKDADETTLFGVLCLGSYFLNASPEHEKANEYFKGIGKMAWDAWGHGKEKEGTAFKDMTPENVIALLHKIGAQMRPFPFFDPGHKPKAPVTASTVSTPAASAPVAHVEPPKPAPRFAKIAIETPGGAPGPELRQDLKDRGFDYLDINYDRIATDNALAKSWQGSVREDQLDAVKKWVDSWGGVLIRINK